MTDFPISKTDPPLEPAVPGSIVSLESILCTEELRCRASRPPDFEKENRALVKLQSALADSPDIILQTLTETILEITHSDSAAVSLLSTNNGGKRFYWPAIAGKWKPHIGGGTPRDFGPCGDVLDRNCPLLMQHIERRYTYFQSVTPLVEECLLVPFYLGGKAVGTIWAVLHDARRKYDSEDERVMGSLGKFAASAYQTLASIENLKFQIAEREKAETALLQLNNDLEARVRIRTEQLEERNQAMRRSEFYLSEGQRLAHTGSWAFDTRGFDYWSEELFQIYGFDPAQGPPTLEQYLAQIHPQDREFMAETIKKMLAEQSGCDLKKRIVRPDGAVRIIRCVGVPVFGEDGVFKGFVGTAMDITEQEKLTQRLVAQRTVAQVLAEAATLEEATPRILQAVCECLVWDVGGLWRTDRAAGVLRFVQVWHKESVKASRLVAKSRDITFVPGIGLPGRVWSSREPAYIPDIVQDSNFPRAPAATDEGLHAAFAFPILLRGEVVGVMEFFSQEIREPDQYLLEMMVTIGSQIGQFIERKRAEQELRRRQAYLAEAQRLSHTGSFGWSVGSGKIVWSDETFRIFGFDRETEPTVNLVVERIHPDDRAMVRELIERASDGKDFDIEYRLLFPDGAVKHVHVVAHAMKDELGRLEFVGAVMDITQAKQARAALHARADVSAALSKAVSSREMLRECAEAFVRRLDASFARIWTLNPEGTKLELQASAGIYTRLDGSYSCIPFGHLKVGSIASEKKPHLTNNVLTDPRIADKEWARSCGIVSFAGYPLLVERRTIGVMAMFSRYPLSDDTLDTLASVADAIAQGIDRKRVEVELETAFKQIQIFKDQLYKENIALREEIDQTSMFEEIVGTAPPLKEVLARVSKVAPTDSTVLITGETGTGKELIARAIHKRSARASRVFVSVNCAGIPPALVASELFGHEKGAFTGALQRRIGRFELAEGGTIFLDEIGELPMETQIALLRVLQEREFERVGGGRPIRADIRLIAATNRDFKAAIASGSFRSDLFYRLNVFPIEMPSLRARTSDIPLLAEYFIHRYVGKMGKRISRISRESLQMLQSYSWPGNIRELQNVIERSVIVCETETLTVDESWFAGQARENSNSTQPLSQKLASDEKSTIETALAEARGRVSGPSGAAIKLGMPASTLESKIRALKINKHSFKAKDETKSES